MLRDYVLIPYAEDGFNNFRKIYNDIIEEKILEGRQGIEQERYLTLTIERKNFEEAKAQFATLEATIHKAFIELGADIVPLTGNERLKVLHDFYHLGDEDSFDFDIKTAKKVGADFKNDLCNGVLKFFPDHFEDESKFCRALFIKKYPSSLSDRFLNEITSLPVHSISSIDVVPVPKDLTTKTLQKKYLGIESDIIKQQRVRNKNNDFSTEISYAKRTEKREIEAIMDDVRENDQCLFYVAVTIILMAESKEELESITETVETIGKRNSCVIEPHYYKQKEALNTALPIGVRQVETMRTMLTQSLAVLMPFNVQELNDKGGNYYGINQISKNINIGNRKKLINGNGFVFGVPGSGKSFFCKMEMGSVFLSGQDEIIVIDPMNEYFDVARTYGGTVVNMSTYTDNYVNPLSMDVWNLDLNDTKGWIREKGEFMLGLCEQCIGDSLNSRQKSIIDRCVRKLYTDIAKRSVEDRYIPIMEDFYKLLLDQQEDEAKDIALSLELFVRGSLNIFNHQTNVDVDNRFTVYGIRDLGTELMDIHVKQEKRIDIHMKKKPDIKDRLKGSMQTDSSGKGFKALKDSFMQQEQSIKMKDKSLFLQKGSMAAEVGRAGMERMSEEVEGGDEIRDAAYTAGYVLSPVKQTAQNISQQGAELVRKKFRKKISEKQKQRLKRVDVKKKMLIKSTENTAKEVAKRGAKAVVKGTAKTAAQETSKETAKAIATETAKATAEVAATVGTEAAATTAGSSCGPVGALIGIGAGAVIGYEVGKKMEEADSRRTIRMRKIKWFIDKTRSEEEQKDSLFKMIRDITARKILEKIKVSLPIIGLLAFLLITTLISVVAPIVLTLGVAYNSPLAIFFPMPETGYEDPRTVLSGYYMEFNQNIIQLEENGETVTYCNTNNGAPISNYNDTLAVYMILYGDGQAGYVMDDAGKQHLREVFDEMNYSERTTVSVETQVGDSIGTAWVTGYCPCSICCGPYANGITASGATATPNHTIAVDAYNPIVPLETKVVVDGVEYASHLNIYKSKIKKYKKYFTKKNCGRKVKVKK